MIDVLELFTAAGEARRVHLRTGTARDRATLARTWLPVLEVGPDHWLDRDWPWLTFGVDDLHLDSNPEWLVLADEVEAGATGDILGVLVTTGPASAEQAGIEKILDGVGNLIWVEYIAIAPSIRGDCPPELRRESVLKAVGQRLMRAAIARSIALGLDGRIALHAEGERARATYTNNWGMRLLGEGAHRVGGAYPVCFGDAAWAVAFRAAKKGGSR